MNLEPPPRRWIQVVRDDFEKAGASTKSSEDSAAEEFTKLKQQPPGFEGECRHGKRDCPGLGEVGNFSFGGVGRSPKSRLLT